MFCSRCGTSLADGSKFCVECGHTVEESAQSTSAPAEALQCSKCGKGVIPGARYCAFCGTSAPVPIIINAADGAATAATPALETRPWKPRSAFRRGRILMAFGVIVVLVGTGWVIATDKDLGPQIKSLLTSAHAETITDGSIAIKPHGFESFKVTVPEAAIDVAISGQFDANGRGDNSVQVLVMTASEFVVWQGGYTTSPFYDSGNVSRAAVEAPLPSHAGTYYLIFSNKSSRVEKTVRAGTGLRYNTWLPDDAVAVKEKIVSWFE